VALFYAQMGINGQTVGRKNGHSEYEWCLRKNFILLQYDVASFGNRIPTFRGNVCAFLQRSKCPRRHCTNERLKMRTLRCHETLGSDFRMTQRDVSEERNLLLHCCSNLKIGRRSTVIKFVIHEISGEVFVLAEFCMGSYKVYFLPKFNKLCQSWQVRACNRVLLEIRQFLS
jgi:hypothetical protein